MAAAPTLLIDCGPIMAIAYHLSSSRYVCSPLLIQRSPSA